MKKALDILFGSLQTILLALMVAVSVVGFAVYVMVHTRLAGMIVEQSICDNLSEQLGTRVTLEGEAEVSWNNQVVLNRITIYDQQDQKMLYARRAMVAFEIWPLLRHHLVLNTCQFIDFELNAYRASADSVTNYQFVIDALSSQKPDSQPFIQQFDLNFIVLRQGTLNYDVLDKPHVSDSPIDPNHIHITGLSSNVHVHDKELLIRKFHCDEHGNSYRADRIKLALNYRDVLKAPAGEHQMLIFVKGLQVEGRQLTLRADVNGDSDTIDLILHQLSLPHGYPGLPEIQQLDARNVTVKVSQLNNPIDSLYLAAQIREIEAQTSSYGRIQVTGSAEGTPQEAHLSGVFTSDNGDATLNADYLRSSDGSLRLTGHCTTDEIDLAQFLPASTMLGKAAADVEFGLMQHPSKPWQLALRGDIGQIEWRGHNYHDIKLDCEGNTQMLKGTLALKDSLGDASATFDIDQTGRNRHLRLDGEIAHLNPNALRLCQVNQLDDVAFTSRIHADISNMRTKDTKVDVVLSDLVMARAGSALRLGDLNYQGTSREGHLLSRVAQASYALVPEDKHYDLRGKISQSNELLSLLQIPVRMSQDIPFEARIDSARHLTQGYLRLPEIEIDHGNYLAATLTVTDSVGGVVRPQLDIDAHNSTHRLHGRLLGRLFSEPQMLAIYPSTFYYNNKEVLLDGAQLVRNEQGDLYLHNLRLRGDNQEVAASGLLSHNGNKDFVVRLSDFELGQIFSNLKRGYLNFSGKATGEIIMSSKPDMILSAENLSVEHFCYIDTLLGDASLSLAYRIPQGRFDAQCHIQSPTHHSSDIDFAMDLAETSTLDLQVHPDHLPLGFINYWTGDILQQFSGTVTEDVRLYGPTDDLQLAGHPYVDGHFTHSILGAHFHLTDTVHLSRNLIQLNHARVDDGRGHPLTLDADISHTSLHDFLYSIDVRMPNANQGFLVLDRPKAPGRIYWGQIYAQGDAHLEGGNGKHRIDVDFATTDRSWLFVSPRTQDVSPDQQAYSFITFRDKDKLLAVQDTFPNLVDSLSVVPTRRLDIPEETHSDIEVNIVANATEQCEVTVQMDPTSEDLLIGRGNGTLYIGYNPQRDLSLSGEYRVSSGSYIMNFNPDVMNKRFQLQNTSFVTFNGTPGDATLKLDAVLPIPSVNLADLGEQIMASRLLSRSTVPVDCKMNVSGQIANPLIEFDLEVKNGNKELNDLVRNTIGTPEMINQQVLYLLIFSKFYPPENVQSSSQMRPGAELTSLASATISSQLNQLLNRLSNNFTLGTNIKSDRADLTRMEMDLSLSTRLLNDRLLLYGNFGYRDPANRIGMMGNPSSFIGDFDIEYIVNDARTLRVKVYSHYNERDYSINNALTTQGVGLVYNRDFKTFWQIWQLKNWQLKKQIEAILPGGKQSEAAPAL